MEPTVIIEPTMVSGPSVIITGTREILAEIGPIHDPAELETLLLQNKESTYWRARTSSVSASKDNPRIVRTDSAVPPSFTRW